MNEKFADKKINPAEEWQILDSKDEIMAMADELRGALGAGDAGRISEILRDSKNIMSLIVNRGAGNAHLDLLRDSMEMLVEKRFGTGKNIGNVPGEEIVRMVHEDGLSEQVLPALMAANFHERQGDALYHMGNIIEGSGEEIKSETARDWAGHIVACWKAEKGGEEREEALKMNNDLLARARRSGNKILEGKAEYLASKHKDIPAREKADDFAKIAVKLREAGDEYDAFNANVEEARFRLVLAQRQQSQPDERKENLRKAKDLALTAYQYAKDAGYHNLEVKAAEVLSGVYGERGEDKSARRYGGKAAATRESYQYKTKN
jgi:hypothetical protein